MRGRQNTHGKFDLGACNITGTAKSESSNKTYWGSEAFQHNPFHVYQGTSINGRYHHQQEI